MSLVNFSFLFARTALFMLFSVLSFLAAAGDFDTSFKASVYNTQSNLVSRTVVQPDGKILIGGLFSVVGNTARNGIARLNTDGSLDSSFDPVDLQGDVYAIALQPDGKILIGGQYQVFNSTRKTLIRLNADGSLDASFADLSSRFTDTGESEIVNNIRILPDGKIYFSGNFRFATGRNLAYVNADGSVPATNLFMLSAENPADFAIQPDGKLVVADGNVKRFYADGSIDNTFQTVTTSLTKQIEILPDNKILIAGTFTSASGIQQGRISRINTDGSVDNNFNVNGLGANGEITDFFITPDGHIFICGNFNQYNGFPRNKIAKLNSDGTLDFSFNYIPPAGFTFIREIDITDGEDIFITGNQTGSDGGYLTRLLSEGTIDSSWSPAQIGSRNASVRDFAVQPDGKIIAAGFFTVANGVQKFYLVRFNADGAIDNTFTASNFTANPLIKIALQPDGKILVSGSMTPSVIRLYSDGSRDNSFQVDSGVFTSGSVHDIDVLADNRILLNGYYLLQPNGTPHTAWSPPFLNGGVIRSAIIQPDGKVIIAGSFNQLDTTVRGNIARLNSNGTIDTTFNPPGGANASIFEIDLQSDGKIIVGGLFTALNGDASKRYLARLNPDGSLDAGFSPAVDSAVNCVKIQRNGKILFGGAFSTVNGISLNRYARLDPDGTIDDTFAVTTGANSTVWRISLQTNGKILLGGDFNRINGVSNIGTVRLFNDLKSPQPLFDFDGDAKTDISIFRPSSGEWWYQTSSNGGNAAFQFGTSSDKLVPADFTGDAETDIAVWRPSTGEWFILRSEDNSFYSYPFGLSSDVPAVGDFDGDEKADSAVFRPSDTNWYILRSTDGGTTILPFGVSGDVPVCADYDADGKTDIAVFRPSFGEWWIRKSSDSNVIAFQFGNSTDKPVQGDFTGDGKADIGVFREPTGEWFILRSEDASYYSFPFGTVGDIPAPGDYDGDGRFDASVFRPSDSMWYVQRTTAGTLIQNFGQSGDRPVPNAFVP